MVGGARACVGRGDAPGEAGEQRPTSATPGTCRSGAPRRRAAEPDGCRASAADHAADARPLPRLRRARRRRAHWDEVTRELVARARRAACRASGSSPPTRSRTLGAFCDVVLAQDAEPRIPVLEYRRREAVRRASSTATGTPTCPTTARPGAWSRAGLDEAARGRGAPTSFAGARTSDAATRSSRASPTASCTAGVWDELPCSTGVERSSCARVLARVLLASVGVERDRLRRPGLPARATCASAPARARALRGRRRSSATIRSERRRRAGTGRETPLRTLLKGALGPRDNDSRFLLDAAPPRRSRPRRDGRATATTTRSTC